MKLKIDNVRCEKCGHLEVHFEGKCPECGEYLYPFYLKQKRSLLIKQLSALTAVILVLCLFFIAVYRTRDTLKPDLRKYLTQIQSANKYIEDSNQGAFTDRYEVLNVRLEDINNKVHPYFRKSSVKKAMMEFRFQTENDLYNNKYYAYVRVIPTNPIVKEIHDHLLLASKTVAEAYTCFTTGIKIGTISNVDIKDDETITWRHSYGEKDSDCFKSKKTVSEEEYTAFMRSVIPFIEQTKLDTEFSEAFPGELEVKNVINNYIQLVSQKNPGLSF